MVISASIRYFRTKQTSSALQPSREQHLTLDTHKHLLHTMLHQHVLLALA